MPMGIRWRLVWAWSGLGPDRCENGYAKGEIIRFGGGICFNRDIIVDSVAKNEENMLDNQADGD